MSEKWMWVLLDAGGDALRATEPFESRADAEAWLASEWQHLHAEGAEEVVLHEDDRSVYRMGLSAG